jgi:hypothetical protein
MKRVTIVVDVLANADPQRAEEHANAPHGVERGAAEDRRRGRERRDAAPHLLPATAPGEARQYRFRSFHDRRRAERERRLPVASDTRTRTCNHPVADEEPPLGFSACDRSAASSREEILVRIDDADENGPSLHWLHIRV